MGKSKEIQPKQVDTVSPLARGLSNDVVTYSRSLLNRGPQQVADLSAGENNVLSQIFSSSQNRPMEAATPLLSDILSGNRLSPNTNPYISDVLEGVRTNANRNLGQGMDQLDAMFGKTGMGSGSGRSVEAIEMGRQSTSDLNTTIANMLADLYGQGRQEQMSTLSMLPSFQTSDMNTLTSALSALSLPRMLEQQQMDYNYSNVGDNALLLSQILGSQPGYQIMQPQYAPSTASQILSAAGPLMSGAGTLMAAF